MINLAVIPTLIVTSPDGTRSPYQSSVSVMLIDLERIETLISREENVRMIDHDENETYGILLRDPRGSLTHTMPTRVTTLKRSK